LRVDNTHAQFERIILPHLSAAYNLARWLTRNDQDAEDVVQEACLRAFRYLDGFRGGDSRAWFLTIVRHSCYTWLQKNRTRELTVPFDIEDDRHWSEEDNPEKIVLQSVEVDLLRRALEELPPEFREVIVLREMENLSYKEIAHIADLPIGTVMSRLGRARARLLKRLNCHRSEEAHG
jgi:RNA polymerase sigma-70 factor (ECF subfamily)